MFQLRAKTCSLSKSSAYWQVLPGNKCKVWEHKVRHFE